MPGARRAAFKQGGGGFLRGVDGTITGLRFSDVNPNIPAKPAAGKDKKSAFRILWALFDIQVDGADKPTSQGLFVGDADVFGVTEDGQGITGEGELGRSEFTTLYNSLVDAAEEAGVNFEEDRIPVDPEGIVADYSGLVGVRARFDWRKNDWKTQNLAPKVRKDKDGKPMKGKDGKPLTYDREDLVVTAFHGYVDVDATPGVATKPAAAAARPAKPVAAKAAAVDIEAITTAAVQAILGEAKDNKLPLSKVSVKLLNALKDQTPETREAARTWLGENPESIEDVDYDTATKTLSV